MNTGDHVYLDDPQGRVYGKVTALADDGICVVKWDSGTTERVHESELVALTTPYADDDPKHPTFRERLSALWDMRPGK